MSRAAAAMQALGPCSCASVEKRLIKQAAVANGPQEASRFSSSPVGTSEYSLACLSMNGPAPSEHNLRLLCLLVFLVALHQLGSMCCLDPVFKADT